MKKLLAMVLALVMTLSLAVSANAAFKDADKVNETYAEAVDVLAGMKVFQGYEDGSFQPEGAITRAEVAAIVYRIYTADVAKNDKSGLYASYNKFSDMAGASWAAGYIGYCANAELVKGYPDGTFKPSGKVTGYEVLAMILRAVGYDKNGEFSGADWALHVAQTAQQADMLKNVKGVDLNAAATRELVAELLFRGIQTSTVTYTPAFGYVTDKVIGAASSTIGVKNFDLKSAVDSDEWGRPATTWTYNTGDKSTTVVEKPDVTYTVATTECDISHDIGLKDNTTFTLYTNGSVNDSKYVVQPLDTVQKLGAQGTLLEVYKSAKVIVSIDTFLAKVTDVKEMTYDAQGHLKAPAMITMTVYSSAAGQKDLVLTDSEENYAYAKGDYVLLNAYTTNSVNATTGAVTVGSVTNASTAVATYGNKLVIKYGEIIGKADSITGAQTFLWYNNLKHTVNGTNYDDAKWFELDEAGTETTNHTWFFDSYGNLIGAVDIDTQYAYGIIENIQWQNPAMATGYAQATIRYMDGTTEVKVVSKINGKTLTYTTSGANPNFTDSSNVATTATVSTSLGENAPYCGADLYRIETAADGTVSLVHVFHTDNNTVYNSHLTNATIKGNGTLTALAAITGTAVTGDSHNVIYTNSNTTFLVRSSTSVANVYTYTVVKGYENVANYTNATVDYVNLDGDSYADYVYITGEPADATYFGMFYLTDSVVQATLKADGGVDFYTINGIVDGKEGSIKLDGAATVSIWNTTSQQSENIAVSTLSKTALESLLASYKNKMFTVKHVNDVVVAMWGPKTDVADLYNETNSNVAYTDLALDYQAASSTTGTITKNGNVLQVNGVYYNILNNLTTTTNGYAWAENEDLSGKNVYVVYDKAYKLNDNTYVAKEVYVADPASAIDPSAPVVPGSAKLTYKIVMVNPTTGDETSTVFSKVDSAPNGTYTLTLNQIAQFIGVSTTNLTAYGQNSKTVVVNGVDQEVVFYAYYAA